MGNGPPPLPLIPYPSWLQGGTPAPAPGASPPSPPPPPPSLTSTVRGLVDIYGPVHYEGLIAAIHGASTAERQAVLNDPAMLALINTRLDGAWASTVMSSLLEGSQKWTNPPGNDFFKHFVTDGQTGTVGTGTTMNCWESIMYGAYLSGDVSPQWIQSFYQTAMAAPDPNASVWQQLGFSSALPHYAAPGTGGAGGVEPKPGQLIFFQSGSGVPGHVAVSLGGDQMISLWNQPGGVDSVQRISVSQLSGTVYVGNPPW
jgi:hypothetical protein